MSKNDLIRTRIFNKEEKEKVNNFFFRLKNMYPGKYEKYFPTEIEESAVKREWANKILSLTDEEISTGFQNCLDQKSKGDEKFQWPDPSNILSGARRYGNASHRPFLPPPPKLLPSKEKVAENLKKLRGIFD